MTVTTLEAELTVTALTAPNLQVRASNGVDYRYRRWGHRADAVPMVFLQHFRGKAADLVNEFIATTQADAS